MKTPLTQRLLVLSILLLGLLVPTADADENKRREFIENLFRSIIESQRDRQPFPGPGIPVQPYPQNPAPPAGQPQVPPAATPQEINQYRSLVQSYSQQLNALTTTLTTESSRLPGLRSYLPELHEVRTRAMSLQQNSGAVNQLPAVAAEFGAVDNAWRGLSFRLRSDPSVAAPCRQTVNAIDQTGQQLCALMGIQADFNRTEAIFLIGRASASIDSLVDVIQHDLVRRPEIDQLAREGRQLSEVTSQLTQTVMNQPLEAVTQAFQQWGNSWDVYHAKLHSFRTPPLNRAIGRVRNCQMDLFELVRIERAIDYQYLSYLSSQTEVAVQTLFGRLSIRALGPIPRNQLNALFTAEQNLTAQLQQFSTSLQGTPNRNQITRNFLSLEAAWQSCVSLIGNLSGQVATDRAAVETLLGEIRTLLPVSDPLYSGLTLSKAAGLEGQARALYNTLAQRAQFIPAGGVRNQVFLSAQQFLQQCSILHAQVSSGSDHTALQATSNALVDAWQSCSLLVQRLPAQGVPAGVYQEIERARLHVDPAVAEIAVILSH